MRLSFEASCDLYGNPYEACILPIKGYVLCHDDVSCGEYIVARSRMYLFDHGMALEKNMDPFLVLDSISSDVADFTSFYTSKGYLSEKKFGSDIFNHSLLILDRLEVSYPFRGCNLGRIITQKAVRLYGPNVGLVGMMACPQQFNGEDLKHMQYELYPQNKSAARSDLFRYYEKFGFIRLGRSNMFYLIPEEHLSYTSPYDSVNIEDSQDRLKKLLAIVPDGVPEY